MPARQDIDHATMVRVATNLILPDIDRMAEAQFASWCKHPCPLTGWDRPIICHKERGHTDVHRFTLHDSEDRHGQTYLVIRWSVTWNNDNEWPPARYIPYQEKGKE